MPKENNTMMYLRSSRSLDQSAAGLVTVQNWTMAPDGEKYLFFWAEHWQLMTDADVPVEGFRSSERWQMIAIDEKKEILAIFPGCQVKAWLRCKAPPQLGCFAF